jgi:hypothetical protein
LQYHNRIGEAKQFSIEPHMKMVWKYGTTRWWESMYVCGSRTPRKKQVKPNDRNDRVQIFKVWYDKMNMGCYLSYWADW